MDDQWQELYYRLLIKLMNESVGQQHIRNSFLPSLSRGTKSKYCRGDSHWRITRKGKYTLQRENHNSLPSEENNPSCVSLFLK